MVSFKKNVDLQNIIDQIYRTEKKHNTGKIATYIPGLKEVNPSHFAINITTVNGKDYSIGDFDTKFSIQSIAKVLFLTLALEAEGEKIWSRVGVEPSGSAFNSLVQLEYENGIPRNPFINAGAIVVCDILASHYDNPKVKLLEWLNSICENPTIGYNAKIAEAEKNATCRNLALIHLMKEFGNIKNDIEIVIDIYCYFCSLEMSCQELCHIFLFLAAQGKNPINNKTITTPLRSKRINALMQLCGFYDEAGEFAFKIGLPGKSGVGGGIIAILPNHYSVAVWSPKLNAKGNSVRGMKALEALTTLTHCSIF